MSMIDLKGAASMAIQQAQGPNADSLRSKDQAEAARAFESFMVQTMVKEMRKTIPEGMLSSSAADMFMDIFDQEIASRIADSGGLGFESLLVADGTIPGGMSGIADLSPVSLPSSNNSLTIMKRKGPRAARAKVKVDGNMPVSGAVITSRFGKRTDPFHGKVRNHKGVDFAAKQGTPITPVKAGTVVSAGKRGGYGNVVVVDHGDGTTSLYAHCHELKVQKGQRVGRGDVIATVGSTGRSTGPHLHLEVHKDGSAIDPMSVLDEDHGNHHHNHAHGGVHDDSSHGHKEIGQHKAGEKQI
ncbi:MAG: peptidoglycan DD-metalloendopeptidase family protein [Myxococcota bacterium]